MKDRYRREFPKTHDTDWQCEGLGLKQPAKLLFKKVQTMESLLQMGYLDPGTGSMLLQAIVGGSAGLIVLARHFWRSIRYPRTSSSELTASTSTGR